MYVCSSYFYRILVWIHVVTSIDIFRNPLLKIIETINKVSYIKEIILSFSQSIIWLTTQYCFLSYSLWQAGHQKCHDEMSGFFSFDSPKRVISTRDGRWRRFYYRPRKPTDWSEHDHGPTVSSRNYNRFGGAKKTFYFSGLDAVNREDYITFVNNYEIYRQKDGDKTMAQLLGPTFQHTTVRELREFNNSLLTSILHSFLGLDRI